MNHLITAAFSNSDNAKKTVEELRTKGYTDAISVIARDSMTGEIHAEVAKDNPDTAKAGAVAGGVIGTLIGILTGAITIVAPGVGPVFVYGPLTATWGIAGGTVGALAGGLIGPFTDMGIPHDTARDYEERIKQGYVIVIISVEHSAEKKVKEVMQKYKAVEISVKH